MALILEGEKGGIPTIPWICRSATWAWGQAERNEEAGRQGTGGRSFCGLRETMGIHTEWKDSWGFVHLWGTGSVSSRGGRGGATEGAATRFLRKGCEGQ